VDFRWFEGIFLHHDFNGIRRRLAFLASRSEEKETEQENKTISGNVDRHMLV
jgi:hypothetical protein